MGRIGLERLHHIVERLGTMAEQGQKVAILWDMDGTLVDTRPRMLASVHAYGRTDVLLSQVSPSWQETATLHHLCPDRFRAVWQRVFWAYESFDADLENEPLARLARRAEELGVQTVIVTGRIEELRPVTARQLQRLGLKPTRVFLKSELGDCTPTVKAEVIDQLAQEGLQMGAFVTDSLEELAAVTPEILARVPGLELIFVALQNLSPPSPPNLVRVELPFYNGPSMCPKPQVIATESGSVAFGFEAEYEIERADRLLQLYEPLPVTGLTPQQWQDWSCDQRADWVRAQFPYPHSEEFDLPLIRNHKLAELDFLPPDLFVDSDGNIEIVSRPSSHLDQLWDQIERLQHACGSALMQLTISVPADSIYKAPNGQAAFDGFLSFYQLHDTLERMQVGHLRYLEDPTQEVLRPFLHPWLGPPTRGKHRFLRMYLDANFKGERLDDKWVRLVDRAFSSFKYINASAYRPALAGPDRIAIEIRDAHRNLALLAQRLCRTTTCLVSGLQPFIPFSQTWSFDSQADYDGLPQQVRHFLEAVIPTRVRREIDHMYSAYDRVALEVYRNFAFPLKDYADVEEALGQPVGQPRLLQAQQAYKDRLLQLTSQYQQKSEDDNAQVWRQRLQAALCAFAQESGLLELMRHFSANLLATERAKSVWSAVESFLPLSLATPSQAWTGPLTQRLNRLARLWPQQVGWHDSYPVSVSKGQTRQQPVLVLSLHGLESDQKERLRNDVLLALAQQTLGVRSSDRGSLQLRFGANCYLPGQSATQPVEYQPLASGAGLELLLCLSPSESYRLGRQLSAHHPCPEAARRVSASGWLRHLRLGGPPETLENVLNLEMPTTIETAAQVLQAIVRTAPSDRLACLVAWTPASLAQWQHENPILPWPDSSIQSGFPDWLHSQSPLRERMQEMVQKWPSHARLVEQVPFWFGKQQQLRSVLVLAPNALSEKEFDQFGQDFLITVGCDTVSFPLRYRAEHLRTRVGALALALSAEGVRVDFYEPPWQRRRMEILVELQPSEMLRLRRYVGHVIDDTLAMLGPITLGSGCRTTKGLLHDNRPDRGGEHNCTSWVSLAPIGCAGETLAQLVEMPDSWESHDNPGWWATFLSGASRSPRVHTVVYWTDQPLALDPTQGGQVIEWDYNPR